MKHFFVKLFIFSFPIILALFFLEFSLRAIPNNYKYKRTQLLKLAEDIKILVLGSSHAFYGVNPDFLSLNGFNFSNISQTLDLDYVLLKKYGNKLNNLEYVIIPISYSSLFGSLSTGSEQWRVKNYHLYYNVIPYKSQLSIKNFFELANGTVKANIKRLYNYTKGKPNFITVTDKGFGSNFSSSVKNDMVETGKAAALRHTRADKARVEYWFEYNKPNIDKIINWCNNRNIKLIFCTFPAYFTYRENLDEFQLNTMINYMNTLNNNDIYYYNLLADDSFLEEDFFDADHLNEIGAMKLTKILDGIIKDIDSQ